MTLLAVSIPKEYIPAVEKGVREAAEGGVLAGYPVTDIKVRLYDGSFHEVDSNEMAFKMAGSMAFKEGMQKAGPVLLEPIMKVEVIVPEEFLGDIIGQLNARRVKSWEWKSALAMPRRWSDGSSGRDVWLCHRSALCNPGSWCFYDGI